MQYVEDKEFQKIKKQELLKAVGTVIYSKRKETGKGINRFSYEYDIGNGLLSGLENGKIDSKISTLWKLSDAFGIKCSDLIKMIEDNLGENFNFYE